MAAMPHQSTLSLKGRVAVVIGNWLEFYDFLVFTFFAVMIGDAFFPGESEIARLLGALATFGAGFLTRPLGAAIIGAYADRVGRRAALTLTLLLMALGSGMVALTPSYAQIGLAAPIILVVARLIQGFSCGGEVGAGHDLSVSNPRRREKRAAVTAWQGTASTSRSFVGSLAGVILAATLTREQLYALGMAGAVPARHPHRAGRPVHPPPAARDDRGTSELIDSAGAVLARPRAASCARASSSAS